MEIGVASHRLRKEGKRQVFLQPSSVPRPEGRAKGLFCGLILPGKRNDLHANCCDKLLVLVVLLCLNSVRCNLSPVL